MSEIKVDEEDKPLSSQDDNSEDNIDNIKRK